jgi:subtilisin family serine protease
MKSKRLGITILMVFALFSTLYAQSYIPGKIYIKFQPGYEPKDRYDHLSGIPLVDQYLLEAKVKNRAEEFGFIRKSDITGLKRVFTFRVEEEVDIQDLSEKISVCPGVEYAEPCFLRTAEEWGKTGGNSLPSVEFIPNDPFYYLQWHLPAVYAPSAWDVTTGDPDIIIAITDNGVDWDHPDLASNIWDNEDEVPNNGLDDDDNGFVDDIRGWDFSGNDNNPSCDGDTVFISLGHGTHVAGLASARANDAYGVAGLAPECSIMPIKISSGQYIEYGAAGITYAYENGAKVINCSWGGNYYSQLEADAIANALAAGALVVASAGNDNTQYLHYPSSLDGVLSVAAMDPYDVKSVYSNSHPTVDVCAPGDNIFSTFVTSSGSASYSTMSGTSMASPIVAGLAGLVFSQYPTWSPDQVTVKILNTCDNIDSLNPGYVGMLGFGRINAYRAVGEALPGLRFSDFSVDDSAGGDGDNIPEPGENMNLIVTISNSLQDAQGLVGTLTTDHLQVTILQDSSTFGDIATGATGDNSDNPFQVQLGMMSEGEEVLFSLYLVTSEGYSFNFNFTMLVSPPYANMNIGNVVCTVTNFAALGYQSNPYYSWSEQIGEGFRYPASGGNALYHGTFMLSYGQSRVCASLYRENVFPYEFEWLSDGPIIISTPGQFADQEAQSSCYDHNVFQQYVSSVVVNEKAYAWADTAHDDFVILEYELSNISSTDLLNCYGAMFMDWDIGDFTINSVGYDASHGIGYMYSFSSNYYGVKSLTHPVYAHRAVDNNLYTSYGPNIFSDNVIYQFIVGNIGQLVASGGEFSHITSVGPLNLETDTTVTVAFAIVGGLTFNHMINNAIAAEEAYQSILNQSPLANVSTETEVYLSDPTPNPFNLEVSFHLDLISSANIDISIFDILGREVAVVFQGISPAGSRQFVWKAEDFASGIYFLQAQAGGHSMMKKLILIK